MAGLDDFGDFLKRNEPLAPYLYLKLGGPAEILAQPRSREELSRFVRS
jgi:UDP-N-acetylmuramate dehydrogenase